MVGRPDTVFRHKKNTFSRDMIELAHTKAASAALLPDATKITIGYSLPLGLMMHLSPGGRSPI
jgi:hypothetical protein